MKRILLIIASIFCFTAIFAQQKQQRIVFDFTNGDTASFSLIIRHTNKIIELTGNPTLEIVCHGPGLDLIVKEKTTMAEKIAELQQKFHIVFVACEATMKRRGVDKSQLIPNIMTVPAAILELSSKQQEGWSYIKED